MFSSKPIQIRRFKEQSPARGPVVFSPIAFVQRPVSCVKDGARHELIRRENVGQQPLSRAVELFACTHQEVPVELVGRAPVHDVNGINMLPRQGTIESHTVVADALTEMLIRLKREPGIDVARLALERVDGIIERSEPITEKGVETEPPEQLNIAGHPRL